MRGVSCPVIYSVPGGPSRSLEISPFDRSHTTSHWRSIVTMALSRVVSEIFNVKKCCDLEIGVKGHSRSLRVVSFDRLCSFLLVFFSNFVPKMHHFWDIWLQKCCDVKNRVKGPSRSLEMSPFDRVPMTSYRRSIVTMALSSVVSEIIQCLKMTRPWNRGQRSLKVIESGTIR